MKTLTMTVKLILYLEIRTIIFSGPLNFNMSSRIPEKQVKYYLTQGNKKQEKTSHKVLGVIIEQKRILTEFLLALGTH